MHQAQQNKVPGLLANALEVVANSWPSALVAVKDATGPCQRHKKRLN